MPATRFSPMPRIHLPDDVRQSVENAELPDLTELAAPGVQHAAIDCLQRQVPGLRPLLALAREQLSAVGGVILENCAVQPDPVVAVLSAAFGTVDPEGNGIPSSLVFDVAARRTADGVSHAGTSRGAGEFGLHSDSANFAEPHPYISLACVTARAGHGGESLVASADALAADLSSRGAQHSLRVLADPDFPFPAPGLSEVIRGRVLWRGKHWYVRYRDSTGVPAMPGSELSAEQSCALAELEASIRRPGMIREFVLRPADLWVLDNRRWLHGRRAFTMDASRLLKRCKMFAPGFAGYE